MPTEEFSRPIEEGKFREKRMYLSPEAFALYEPGDESPTDLIEERQWQQLTDLPTDVLLMTTDHFGSQIKAMHSLSYMWICSVPISDDAETAPLVFDSYLDAHDEFEAAPFIAASGYYRQGTSCLRNALEVITNAARFALRNETAKYATWRDGTADPPKFGNSLELITKAPAVVTIETAIASSGELFGWKPNGIVGDLYEEICRYTHGHVGHTNADIRRGSNGPIFVPEAFAQFWRDYRDTFLACFLLLKLAYPELGQPRDLPKVAANAGAPWRGLASAAVSAFF